MIFVGEIRDPESALSAIQAAETGHLVISTLHTIDCTETINRILDLFPPQQQREVRTSFAGALRGIVSQRLVARADGRGRVPAVEVLVATGRVFDRIVDPDATEEIVDVIAEGDFYGMQTFDQCLVKLVQEGLVTEDDARRSSSTNPHDFSLALRGVLARGVRAELRQQQQLPNGRDGARGYPPGRHGRAHGSRRGPRGPTARHGARRALPRGRPRARARGRRGARHVPGSAPARRRARPGHRRPAAGDDPDPPWLGAPPLPGRGEVRHRGARKGDTWLEITTYREEVYQRQHRKPAVTFAKDLEADLSRRDFTINAMAVRLPDGTFVDPFGGVHDLAAKRLDTPLEPQVAFDDDPLGCSGPPGSPLSWTSSPYPASCRRSATCTSACRSSRPSASPMSLEAPSLRSAGEEVSEIVVSTGLAGMFLPELPALALGAGPGAPSLGRPEAHVRGGRAVRGRPGPPRGRPPPRHRQSPRRARSRPRASVPPS